MLHPGEEERAREGAKKGGETLGVYASGMPSNTPVALNAR